MIEADRSGADPLALETYLMNLNWMFDVDAADGSYGPHVTWGDGAAFNLIGNDEVTLRNVELSNFLPVMGMIA